MENKKTAVGWLIEVLKSQQLTTEIIYIALEMERCQHGKTWDAAIQAHDNRGHVHARSLIDFDDYEVGC